ncbi:MAG: Hsp70 family protein [Desulfobacterales bacterium]|nr:Hsp70 family protein [Desulfobacterales bacterium]
MSKSIGIDLGTTNSVGAIRKVHTEVLKNAEGDLITPSCVTLKKKGLPFSKPDFVVGKHAGHFGGGGHPEPSAGRYL